MLDKKRSKAILALSLPIIGGMMSQNILNLVDTAMVGRLGAPALAAVGLGGFLNYMCVAFLLGLSAGVQAMVSRRMGESKEQQAAYPLNAALLLILIAALPMTVLLYFISPYLISWFNPDPLVMEQGTPYLQARFLGLISLAVHFSFRGYWSAINMTKVYLKALLFAHTSNIIISYVLIFGKLGMPALGTYGAGLGTSISITLAVFYYFYCGFKHTRGYGFMENLPTKATVQQMIKTSVPSSVQQFFFAAGFAALYWIIGQVGTQELAGANVIINLMLVGLLPAMGFGLGGATLVGQALGKKDVDAAHQWGWDTVKLACMTAAVLMLPVVLFPDLILKVFLTDQAVIDITRLPLQLAAISLGVECIGIVLFNTINGAGDTTRTMKISFALQWIFFLPLAWLVGPYLGMGLTAIWIGQILYRLVFTWAMVYFWQDRKWSTIEV
ncbi:MATE family efflux transporter [Marinicella sp. S1101]|uniref:MATE family efflux transporter n=1 Tax=Marinicella marina TaxID=2996016 RepID=UPI002260E37A|nr:MATE family efflux transporter [Marinicella marina]MCX7553159.1 MATE family efflux transporter [Marinicella marina]MDJ1138891.1 MATE family efflux transporter [Marinicella marina]